MYSRERTIDTNSSFINRTYKYLSPQINLIFNEQELEIISNLTWSAIACGDTLTKRIGYLHLVCELNNHIDHSILYQNRYFVDTYPYIDNMLNKQVFVFEFPIKNFKLFLQGKYSKLYNERQIDELFQKTIIDEDTQIEAYTDVYSVLVKLPQYEKIFLNNLYKEFKTDVIPTEDFEYDYQPLLNEEILNYNSNPQFVNQWFNENINGKLKKESK